jgi:hypothetical protein
MSDLLAVVAPTPAGPGIAETGIAVAILSGLGMLSAVFTRLNAVVEREYSRIAGELAAVPPASAGVGVESALDPEVPTGILLVTGYNRFGLLALLALWESLRDCFPQLLILAIGEPGRDPERLRRSLGGYLPATRAMGLETALRAVADSGDPATGAEKECLRLVESLRAVVFCSGRLELRPERWFHRSLPGSVCEDVRRRLRRRGLPAISLGVPLEMKKAAAPGGDAALLD